MKYTEANFQNGQIVKFFKEDLKWKIADPKEIDVKNWVIPGDLLWFLSYGNSLNEKSYSEVIKNYDSNEMFIIEFIQKAIVPKMKQSVNVTMLLREKITFDGQLFTLFNDPEIVGSSKKSAELFEKNMFSVVPEAVFERVNDGKKYNRRPDLTFFVNGLYFGYSELKLKMQGQSASIQGREKIAHNFVECVNRSIINVMKRNGYDFSLNWTELKTNVSLYNEIMQEAILYTKPVHITSADESCVYIINDIAKYVQDVFDALRHESPAEKIRLIKDVIPEKIIKDFQKMPDLREKSKFRSVLSHLSCLYEKESGIYSEIEFFNNYKNKSLIKPRTAQRVIFYNVKNKVNQIYQNEFDIKMSPERLRDEIKISLPNISEVDLEKQIRDLTKYKNGVEQHSILIQAAAGLGKTNLIVWLSYQLSNMFHPEKILAPYNVRENLFDNIIILTDRTELRTNISNDAQKSYAVETKTTKDLVDAINNNEKIIIYNIQKINGLKNALNEEVKEKLKNKRIAFIIDEVHRSQNGELNKETIELFETCENIQKNNRVKKNLIIGLTATPTEEILVKYGEWRSSCGPTDHNNWVPFISYTMREAINDGYILDPTKNILTVAEKIDYIEENAGVIDMEKIYNDQHRQELIAKEIVDIFTIETMNAIKAASGRNSGGGEGKAIVVENSINTAIKMKLLIEEELKRKSEEIVDNIPETATKKTRDYEIARSERIKMVPVTLVFSNNKTERCADYNDGLKEEDIIDKFRCKNSMIKNSIMVVVDKLLTGFDEPTLHTIFINKNMKDIMLFQAISRVNRIYSNKHDCLVVDMSHNNTVANEIKLSFEKYGDVTLSDFDSLTWQQKMNNAYNYLFNSDKNKKIQEQFKTWKAWHNEAKSTLPEKLLEEIDELFTGSEADLEKAIQIWKHSAEWLNAYGKLKFLLDFNSESLRKHKSEEKRLFAELLRKVVYEKIQSMNYSNDNHEIVFEIVDLERTYGVTIENEIDEDGFEHDIKRKKKNDKDNGVSSLYNIEDIMSQLLRNEMSKDNLVKEVKLIMKKLFQEIDKKSKDRNNDKFVKSIRCGDDFSWEEKMHDFNILFTNATSGISKKRIKGDSKLYDILMTSFKAKKQLILSDYEEWILGNSVLHVFEIE